METYGAARTPGCTGSVLSVLCSGVRLVLCEWSGKEQERVGSENRKVRLGVAETPQGPPGLAGMQEDESGVVL